MSKPVQDAGQRVAPLWHYQGEHLLHQTLAIVPYAITQHFIVVSDAGFTLIDPLITREAKIKDIKNKDPKKITATTLHITVAPGVVQVNNTVWPRGRLVIRPNNGACLINGVRYVGDVRLEQGIDSTVISISTDAVWYAAHTYHDTYPLPALAGMTFLSDTSALPGPSLAEYQKAHVQRSIRRKRRGKKEVTPEKVAFEKRHAVFQVAALEEQEDFMYEEDPDDLNRNLVVRVLLKSWPLQDTADTVISSSQGFTVVADTKEKNGEKEIVPFEGKELKISSADGKTIINGQSFVADKVTMVPHDGHITLGKQQYQGAVQLQKDRDSMLLISCVGIEDYLYAVMRSEGWPGWPVEAYKIMAVTSRTYVIAMAREAHKTGRAYHIKNTNAHQVYGGFHQEHHLREAVDQTRGMFLSYNNQPIIAMFDACCGGLIPAHIKGLNYEKAPYLARTYACTYCKQCPKVYQWTATYSIAEIESLLKQEVQGLKKLKEMSVTKKDKAGTIHELAVKCSSKRVHKVSGRRLYSMLKNVKSFCYSVKKRSDTLVFEGKGLGHHMGLCQWGAREMVREGYDYQAILDFYYPGTILMKLA